MSGGDSLSFMIVSQIYLIQPVSILAEVTLRFSRRQLILHVHMSQPVAARLFFEHSSYLTQYKKSVGEMNGRKTARPK